MINLWNWYMHMHPVGAVFVTIFLVIPALGTLAALVRYAIGKDM